MNTRKSYMTREGGAVGLCHDYTIHHGWHISLSITSSYCFPDISDRKRISKYAFSWLTGYSPLYRASYQRAKITNNQWKQRRICPKSHKILLNFFNLRIRTGEIQKNTINLQKYLKPPCQWMRHKYPKHDKYKEKV